MGTRSITIMRDGDKEIAVLYRQFGGYPSGMGADIAKALGGRAVVNGYTSTNQINGAGDMAVQLIAWLKANSVRAGDPINSAGGLYLYPAGTRGCGEEYTYTITCSRPDFGSPGSLTVSCSGYTKSDSFEGAMDEFVEWIEAAPWSVESEDEDDEESAVA
jgi:hypothetical protein